MQSSNLIPKYLHDYQAPEYLPLNIKLTFEILADKVIVESSVDYQRQSHATSQKLTLNGSSKLLSIQLNHQLINNYTLENEQLVIQMVPERFNLQITTELDPFNNKSCMGLYASQGNLFTQCEPEGFRKITYYLDRPDVMALFTTKIIADYHNYPILLSNGNKISEQYLDNGKVEVIWQDPFKKPSYLFALVAGKFAQINAQFTTNSGRQISLEVYSDENSINQCHHCLASLAQAMRWDEQRFNLEYDLDRYMIVASNDFNMGAMENKGLNVFNTKYVLADAKTATDDDFINVEAVVGHEYFHNWTGNRVTCRDWFQLSLKEGLTVFRDQEFTADLHSRAVKRIQDIKFLRQHQFTEDNSPLSHPVRPDSYIEINNFYTLTIYEKGAEIVRMYQTIFGKKGFEAGLALYFMRHDGQAVTCNEFCQAMADANHYDLNQFMLWYSQAGTPKLSVLDHYDEDTQIYSLTIEQHLATSNQNPMLIPLKIGLLDDNGLELDYNLLEGNIIYPEGKPVLLINQSLNYYRYKIKAKPIPSLLRDFSAPIILNYNYTQEQLFSLANYDSNSFSRWEALQTLYKRAILELYNKKHSDLIPSLINIVDSVIFNHNIDPSMRALLLTLPEVGEFFNEIPELNIHQLLHAINQLKQDLANQLVNLWLKCYHDNQTLCYDIKDAGKRKLKTVALHYLAHATITTEAVNLAISQYDNADNMTDKITALTCLNNIQDPNREKLLANFVTEYHYYPLVMDKWFMLQSQSKLVNTLDIVNNLLNHPNFDATNPNKLFALIRGFTQNHWHFNTQAGYQFIAEQILLIDQFNSGVAGRIAQGFSHLTNLATSYQQLAKPYLNTLLAKNISKDVFEIISKINAQLT